MNSLHKFILALIALLLFGLLCFLTGRRSVRLPSYAPQEPRVDTLLVFDTITLEKPVFTRTHTRDTIYITLTERDTVYLALPREVRVYEDSLYRAEISGFQPNLERIDIYAPVRTVTTTRTQIQTVHQPTRWGIGVQVGYGMTLQGGNVRTSPYVGLGIHYSILTW